MIYLEQGQKLADRPELVVYEQTGERNDADMVICAKAETPTEPFCWLEAQYIAYGGLVYRVSDDKELETEILKIDPDTTINDLATEPVSEETLQNDPVTPEPVTQSGIEQTTPVTPPESAPATSTPSTGTPVSAEQTQEATTTPVTEEVASSTPAIPDPVIEPASTSTPIVEPQPTPEPQTEAPSSDPIVSIVRKIKRRIG